MSAPSITSVPRGTLPRADIAAALVLAGLTFFASLRVSAALDPVLYEEVRMLADGRHLRTFNIWFDADFPKVMAMMMDRQEPHPEFAAKHPLHPCHGAAPLAKST